MPADAAAAPSGDLGRDLNCLRQLYEHFARGTRPTPAPAAARELQLRPDGTLERLGRFHLQEVLGRGGFGMVYRAHDPALGREVALKVPHWDRLASPELQVRFRLEALAAARLDHPHVVKVYEAGTYGTVCYLATELCSPRTLADWLRAAPEPLPWREAAQLLRALAQAVHHAHSRGVLHRDLKPANILLAWGRAPEARIAEGEGEARAFGARLSDCMPKITDFGLAKILEDQERDPTRTGTVLGSPNYMAPEQAAGKVKDIGVTTDVHALGVIAYELFTGKPPYVAPTPLETLQRVQAMEPVPPRTLRSGLPRDLETICLKCLRKQPAQRYASAAELAEDLRRWLEGEPILARPVGLAERSVLWIRRHPWQTALVSVLFVALAVVTWFWRAAEEERQKAIAERKRAEEIAQIPIQAMGDLTERLVDTREFADHHNLKVRQTVLQAILPHFDRYINHATLHHWSQLSIATTKYRMAQNNSILGNLEAALRQLEEARQIAEELVRQDPHSRDKCHLLADICFERGLYQRMQRSQGLQNFQRALELGAKTGDRGLMSRCHCNQAQILAGADLTRGTPAERQQALDHLKQAWKLLQEQTAAENTPAPGPYPCTVQDHMSMLVIGRMLLMMLLTLEEDRAACETIVQTVLAAGERCRTRFIKEPWAWYHWGLCVHDANLTYVRLGQRERALHVIQEGWRVFQETAPAAQQGWPRHMRLDVRLVQGQVAYRIADTFFEAKNPAECARWSEQIIDLFEPIVKIEPEESSCQYALAKAHGRIAAFQRDRGDPARWDHYRHMRRHFATSLKYVPDLDTEVEYATFSLGYITDLIEQGHRRDAAPVLEEMLARMEQLHKADPGKAKALPLTEYRAKLAEVRRQ